MQHLNYQNIQSSIEKILGFELPATITHRSTESYPEIVPWEKLLIANKIETKFGITINDESLEKADSVEDIIKTILLSKQTNQTFNKIQNNQ